MIKGWKLLTKAERKHLSEMKIVTTWQLDETLAGQAIYRIETERLGISDPCWTCKEIARKLGKL